MNSNIDFNVGDEVIVFRKNNETDLWNDTWESEMDKFLNVKSVVVSTNNIRQHHKIELALGDDNYAFPIDTVCKIKNIDEINILFLKLGYDI